MDGVVKGATKRRKGGQGEEEEVEGNVLEGRTLSQLLYRFIFGWIWSLTHLHEVIHFHSVVVACSFKYRLQFSISFEC